MCKLTPYRLALVRFLQVVALGIIIIPTSAWAVTVPATWTGSGDGSSYSDPQKLGHCRCAD